MLSQLITGTVMIVGGLVLCLGFVFLKWNLVALIYGIPVFILGMIILFNRKEDYIEKREDMKGGNKK